MSPCSPWNRSPGRATPSSSAAAARITLNVDPGSNGSVTARLRRSSSVAVEKRFGLNVGRMATARTSPVRGSMATAMAAFARVRRQAASTSRSAMYWSVVSMVSTIPCPGRARLEHGRGRRKLAAERVALHDGAAFLAGQVPVPCLLDPAEAAPVHPLEPDDVSGQLAGRVEPQALLDEAERRLLEVPHRLGQRRRQPALDEEEPLRGQEALFGSPRASRPAPEPAAPPAAWRRRCARAGRRATRPARTRPAAGPPGRGWGPAWGRGGWSSRAGPRPAANTPRA